MKNKNTAHVKILLNKANAELEAHKFDKSKKICYQALKLDSDNPNIYLILLLAEYEVTEIEDLQNCKIDYDSEIYKNVRRYAGQDLHDELNKFLSDKDNYKNNTNITKELIKSVTQPIISFYNSFNQNDKNPHKGKKKKALKQILLDFLSKLPRRIIDFYSDNRGNLEFSDIFDIQAYNNKVKNYNNSIIDKKDEAFNMFSSNESVASVSTFTYFIFLALQMIFLFFAPFSFIEDKCIIGTILAYVIYCLLLAIIKKNYLRIAFCNPIIKQSVILHIFKFILNFVLSFILLISNYIIYIYAIKYLIKEKYFVGLLFGIIGSLVVNYLYIQIYSFFRNLNIVFRTIKNSILNP